MADFKNERPTALKTYEVRNEPGWTARDQLILENGETIYWISHSSPLSFKKSPTFTLRARSSSGPALAASKIKSLGWGRLAVLLGDPDSPAASEGDPWTKTESLSMWTNGFMFEFHGSRYVWKSTNDKSLGASRWSSKDFKLQYADCKPDQEGQNLAVLAWDMGKWKIRDAKLGKIEIFEELGEQLEYLAIAAVLGKVAQVKQSERAAASGGGGGG